MFHSETCKYRTPLVTVRLLAPSLCHYQDKINTEEVFIQTFRDKKRLIESLVEWKKWVKVLTFTNIIIASYCNTCGQIQNNLSNKVLRTRLKNQNGFLSLVVHKIHLVLQWQKWFSLPVSEASRKVANFTKRNTHTHIDRVQLKPNLNFK